MFLEHIRIADASDAPFVSAIVGVDATAYMGRVTTLLSERGGFFLEPITSSVLEAHMFFLPHTKGKEVIRSARAGLRHAFHVMDAAVVFGRIPIENRAGRLLTRFIGFRSDGIRPREQDGPLVEWFEMRSEECPQQ